MPWLWIVIVKSRFHLVKTCTLQKIREDFPLCGIGKELLRIFNSSAYVKFFLQFQMYLLAPIPEHFKIFSEGNDSSHCIVILYCRHSDFPFLWSKSITVCSLLSVPYFYWHLFFFCHLLSFILRMWTFLFCYFQEAWVKTYV